MQADFAFWWADNSPFELFLHILLFKLGEEERGRVKADVEGIRGEMVSQVWEMVVMSVCVCLSPLRLWWGTGMDDDAREDVFSGSKGGQNVKEVS